jgi:hypothetical protein
VATQARGTAVHAAFARGALSRAGIAGVACGEDHGEQGGGGLVVDLRTPVATYDYTDEAGKLLYQVCRFEPKDFRQRQPDGYGGWVWNLKGVQRVLYRLPEVLKADALGVCEGERDADNLAEINITATCNPAGAGKWQPSYSACLKDKRIVIFPDNDDPGRKHALQVATSLLPVAAEVRIAESPPPSKDVSDYLAAGAKRDDIRTLIRQAGALDQAAIDALSDRWFPPQPLVIPEPEEIPPAALVLAPEVRTNSDWRQGLIRGETGKPRAVLANAICALENHPAWKDVLALDEFRFGVVTLSPPPWGGTPGAPWTDQEDRQTAQWLQHQDILVSVEIAGQAAETVAQIRRFHPVRNYLDQLQWDGVPRIDQWLTLYLGVEPSEYTNAIGARWLIQAVARIYRPGAKADCILILEGPQGIKKSMSLATIAEPWFADEISDLGSKDASLQTRGV